MSLEREILKVLAYFDIFYYPLSAIEITKFLNRESVNPDIDPALQQLIWDKTIYKHNEFYSLRDSPLIAEKRRVDNKRAERLLKTACRISSFLFQFPYVRGVGISGSLSKNVAGENADIDFFVITKRNRLWIARTAMHLFKKLTFITGRQHWFCMNYYIDEDALAIPEENIFTAVEVITLLPICGNGTMKRFFDANDWTRTYFPNYKLNADSHQKTQSSLVKKWAESAFDNSFGEWLDNYLMKLTARRWTRKELRGKRNAKGNHMGLRSGKHIARPNPAYFQQKVLLLYDNKLKEIDNVLKSNIIISPTVHPNGMDVR